MPQISKTKLPKLSIIFPVGYILLCLISTIILMIIVGTLYLFKININNLRPIAEIVMFIQLPGSMINNIFNLNYQYTPIFSYFPFPQIVNENIEILFESLINGLLFAPIMFIMGHFLDKAARPKILKNQYVNRNPFLKWIGILPFKIKLPFAYLFLVILLIYLQKTPLGNCVGGGSLFDVCLSWPMLILFLLSLPGFSWPASLSTFWLTKPIFNFLYFIAGIFSKQPSNQDFIVAYIITALMLLTLGAIVDYLKSYSNK